MAVIPNPVGGGSKNPFTKAAQNLGASGVSKGALELANERAQLQKGLTTTIGRISTAPKTIAAGKVNPFTEQARRIAAGGEDKATGVLGSILNSPVGKTLTGAAAVLGTAQRGVVSTLKEGADLLGGEGASFDDWWKQTTDPTFGVGKLIKDAGGLTGNKLLDNIIGFAGDVVTDPLTYVTFGAATFAGRSGRLALATKAAEAASIAKAPTLANKIDDIARVGEWALDDAERAVLGVQKGLRFGMGVNAKVIPKTGQIAEGVGKNWARTRAALGDFDTAQKIMSKTLPASYSGELMSLGRGVLKDSDGGQALAIWTARNHGIGANRVFNSRMGSRYSELMSEISKSPYAQTVALVAEGSRTAVDDAERALADKMLAMQDDLFNAANEAAQEFARKRGITRPVGINKIDNYGVHHSITDDAKAWTQKMADAPTPEYLKMVREGELTVDEMISGVGPARWRKLKGQVVDEEGNIIKAGEDWLGVELKTGSIDEINQFSMEKLGFKWFEEDAVSIMNSYMHSMGKQVNRTAAMDRLMDFGVDYVRPILTKAVPDKELVASWETAVRGLKKAERILRNNVRSNANKAETILGRTRDKVGRVLVDGRERVAATAKQLEDASKALDEATVKLDELQTLADNASGPSRQVIQEAIDSSRAQIEKFRTQIARNDGWREMGHDALVKEYVRVFPNAKKVPVDDEVLVARLRNASARDAKILEKKVATRDRLAKQVDEVRRTAKSGDKRLQMLETDLKNIEDEIAELSWVTEAQVTAPYTDNGLIYMPADGSSSTAAATVLDTNADTLLSQGADPSQVIAMRAPSQVVDITDPENIDTFMQAFSDGIGGVLAEMTRDFPNAIPELEQLADEFASNLAMSLDAVSIERVDELWAQVHPELMKVIDDSVEFKMAAIEAAQVGGDIPEYMIVDYFNAISDAMEAFSFSNGLAQGVGDSAVIDSLAIGIGGMGGDGIGFLVPASVVDATANLGDTSLVLYKNSGLFDPNNLDSAPALLADNPQYLNLSMGGGRAQDYQLDLMARKEGAQQAVTQTQDQLLQNVIEQGQAEAARNAATAEVRQARSAANKSQKGVEEPAELVEKANKVTVYEKDPKTGARKRVVYTRESAERRVAGLEKDVERKVRKLDENIRTAETTEFTTAAGETGTVRGARTGAERAQRVVNKAEILAADAATWEANALPQYLDDIARITGEISRNPVKGVASETATSWAQRNLAMLRNLDEAVRAGDKDLEAMQRIVTQLAGDESDLAILESVTLPRAQMYLSAAESGRIGAKMVDDVEKGWLAIEGLGVQMPKELRDLMYPNLTKLKAPKEFGKVWNLYQEYNKFFKVYATLTPGFSVRNALSSTFGNYVAGVSTNSMKDGLTAAYAYVKYGPDKFLDRLGLTAAERQVYEEAWKRAAATGQGQTINDMFAPIIEGRANRVLKNKATDASSKFNEGVEFAARYAMALNDVRGGLNFDAGVQRISRFHFDYTDLSKLDKAAKQFIPFWIWTSRNVPLQFANMWTRPQMYALYNHLRDNSPPDTNLMLPKWLKESNPVGIGGNFVLNPDLPMNRYQAQIEQLSDPKRLLGNLNPLAKIPFEAYSSTQFSNDIPFGDQPVKASGLDYLAALIASPFGGVERNAEGDILISPKLQYQLGNIIPPIARAQRLLPQVFGGKESYKDRQLSSGATFLGVPVRQVTEQEQKNEAIRRQRELSDLIAELRKRGFIPSER